MSILAWPNAPRAVVCALCNKEATLEQATIACAYSDGRPAIACEQHRSDKALWVIEWAIFRWRQEILASNHRQRHNAGVEVAKFYTEKRAALPNSELKADIGWHLLTRSQTGRSIIVTEKPIEFLSTLKKQWKKMTKIIQLERARTLYSTKKAAFDDSLSRLNSLVFACGFDRKDVDVAVASSQEIIGLSDTNTTVYLCGDISDDQFLVLLKTLKRGALIVDYRKASNRQSP